MKYLLVISYLLLPFTCLTQDMSIPYLDQKISVDGQLDESVWNQLTAISEFYNHFPNDEGQAENQTEVKIFHNKKHLFITAVYHDASARNNIGSLKRDLYEDAFFLSDCFGLAIDPFNSGDNGYFFAVNAASVQFDGLIGNANELSGNWNAIWEAKATTDGQDKYYEIAIPLNAINFNANDASWGIQLFTNDSKINLWTTLVHSPRNFVQYDLRYTEKVTIEQLPNTVTNKYSLIPSIAANYSKDITSDTDTKNLTPSLDGQFNISSSLRLDLTLNPDFSQVEVDQQVTNLSRFAVNFPERRKFFLENSDLFNNLGNFFTNPFYSRRIGSQTEVLYGAKLSGNLGSKTRIGLLNVQTKNEGDTKGKNYTVAVGRYNVSQQVIGTGYIVNTQQNAYYNRIIGSNINYRSVNNKWRSDFQFAKSYTSIAESGQTAIKTNSNNNYIRGQVSYDTRKFDWNIGLQRVDKNYIAETGFIPLQSIYDATTDQVIKAGFTIAETQLQIKHFPENSKRIDWSRRFWFSTRSVLNEDNSLRYHQLFFSPFAIQFKDRSYTYISFTSRADHLKYSFDFLQNGNPITPGEYTHSFGRIGYWSPANRKFYYLVKFEYGQFYGGTRLNPLVIMTYRMMPRATISASYQINDVRLGELGSRTFHLAKMTTEIYLNNQLNWTTYLQYNTQSNNFNINSRIQWEYKPLSYVYLVLGNNYDNDLISKNWGISFKVNRRFDF